MSSTSVLGTVLKLRHELGGGGATWGYVTKATYQKLRDKGEGEGLVLREVSQKLTGEVLEIFFWSLQKFWSKNQLKVPIYILERGRGVLSGPELRDGCMTKRGKW